MRDREDDRRERRGNDPGYGAMFKPDRGARGGPDWRGVMTAPDGSEWEIAGWYSTSKRGVDYLSLKIQEPYEQRRERDDDRRGRDRDDGRRGRGRDEDRDREYGRGDREAGRRDRDDVPRDRGRSKADEVYDDDEIPF